MIAILNLLLTVIVLGLLTYWMLGIKRGLRQNRQMWVHLQDHVWNTALLMREIPEIPFPPAPTGYAAAGDLLIELIKRVRQDKPNSVVELGSGLSTLIIAAELRRQGHGKLVSIDHDIGYAAKTQGLLESSGLATWVEIRVAPLRAQRIGGTDALWYDIDYLSDLNRIDMLFVDGPPEPLASGIRAPALPYFWPKLVIGGKVIMDDAAREVEKESIRRWQATTPDASVQWIPLQKGCAILQKGK